MSITDELREYAEMVPRLTSDLTAIADRIDAEHAEAQRRWMAELDAARDRDGYIELPKDANGEPILIGDVMKGEKIGGGFCEPFEVVGYIMSNGELEPMDEHKCPRKHKYLHHHKQPTVEDVLRDMHMELNEVTALYVGEAIDSDERDHDVSRIFAEYAKRLKLSGDGE